MDDVCALIQTVREKRPIDGEAIRVILSVLHQAGFTKATDISAGKSVGHYLDQDGSRTGETFSLNSSSELVVMEGREENKVASQWLDSLWRYIGVRGEQEASVKAVRKAIDASVPLKPIVLTAFNETLREYPPESQGITTVHSRDDHKFRNGPGVHDLCDSWVDLRPVSPTHNALVCRKCQLRVVIPNSITTYGELRAHFREFNSQ